MLSGGRAAIQAVPKHTTNTSVYVGEDDGLLAQHVPPFFHYALTSRGNVKFAGGDVTVAVDGTDPINASVFTNGHLELEGATNVVHGFGYHAGDVSGEHLAAETFRPAYNPTGLTTHQQVDRIEIPAFDARSFSHLATRVDHGDLTLRGDYTLGTRENPVLWYVDGSVRTDGEVRFSGYGVIYASGDLDFRHSLKTGTGADESALGLFTENQIKISADGIEVTGTLFCNGNIEFRGHTRIVGSVTTAGSTEFTHPVEIAYRPASPALTKPFWP